MLELLPVGKKKTQNAKKEGKVNVLGVETKAGKGSDGWLIDPALCMSLLG